MTVTGEAYVLGEKPTPMPHCPPQILQGLAWVSVIKGW